MRFLELNEKYTSLISLKKQDTSLKKQDTSFELIELFRHGSHATFQELTNGSKKLYPLHDNRYR